MNKNIYLKTLKLFGNKGVRFTTEELARELGTSKRTIYTYFATKDEIIEKTIDFVFEEMYVSDAAILEKKEFPIQKRLELYFQNTPDAYSLSSIVQHMDDLQRYYPVLWEKLNQYLNDAWNPLIEVIEDGIKTGELEETDTTVLKIMLIQTQKKLLDYEFLATNQVSFDHAVKAMGNIILTGLIKR